VKKAFVLNDISPKLAYLLVDIYGGHVLQISRAIRELNNKQENTKIGSSFISLLRSQLIMWTAESKILKIEKVEVGLVTLMETGFTLLSLLAL
jgi:hypothetical protein